MKLTNPTILVIVGITGDLSRRKLIPALYQLEQESMIDSLQIVGTTRGQLNSDELHHQARESINNANGYCDDEALDRLMGRLEIAHLDMGQEEGVARLREVLERTENDFGACTHRLFYLAVPPSVFLGVATLVAQKELDRCVHGSKGKILVEKPFGQDLDSAKHLAKRLNESYDEDQVYRIDHYLAKETAQNINYFKFNNPLIHDIWQSQFVDHIQITVAEELDIEGRVNFYEQTGALRDIVQSHLLQLLALLIMEKPVNFDAACVRHGRHDVLSSIQPVSTDDTVFGQYEGYRNEVENEASNMETFVAMKLLVNNGKGNQIPIYLRTGKALKAKYTDINIMYSNQDDDDHDDNVLIFRIQPNEGIAIKLLVKKPGLGNETQQVLMDYCYERSGHDIMHDAYQKLLIDAMNGDQTLFPSSEEVIASWQVIEQLIKSEKHREPYQKGSWGPDAADELLSRDNRKWLEYDQNICRPHFTPPT